MTALRIAIGDASAASYLQGGGHWSWLLQYLLGFRDLGQDVRLIELLGKSSDRDKDLLQIAAFFELLRQYDLAERAVLLLYDKSMPVSVDTVEVFSTNHVNLKSLISDTDVLLNLACAIRKPLLSSFSYSVLIDGDPGHLQISALTWDLSVLDHDRFLTVGLNVGHSESTVPTLGVNWEPVPPPVLLPMWKTPELPCADAPVTSVTHWWNSEVLFYQDRALTVSKRDAYMRYLHLPTLIAKRCKLAVHLPINEDPTGDRQQLEGAGWELADSWECVSNPTQYRQFIRDSSAELCCAKEVFRDLNTGWFSDRSACYLASGRPVVADDTGFGKHFPIGRGLFAVHDISEAVNAIAEIQDDYANHSRAASEIANEFFDSRRILGKIINI